VLQFSRKWPRSIVESNRSVGGNRQAPKGIRLATVSLPAGPGNNRYVLANEGKLTRSQLRFRLAACMQLGNASTNFQGSR